MTTTERKTRLHDLTLEEISLVDNPACPGAEVLMFKRLDQNTPAAIRAAAENEWLAKNHSTLRPLDEDAPDMSQLLREAKYL